MSALTHHACGQRVAAQSRAGNRFVTKAIGAARRSTVARQSRQQLTAKALFGGSPDEGETEKKKFLTREEEPEEYWSSKSERAGANPFKDPLALIGILAILFPFIFVLVAIATGAIDVSVYK